MAFVKFTQSSGRSISPRVSINPHGTMSFNNGAKKRFNLGDNTHCILYYDAEKASIGIELTNDAKAEGARKLRQRATGADVSVKAFLDFFDIKISSTTMFDVHRDRGNNYVIVNLKTGRERKSRKKV